MAQYVCTKCRRSFSARDDEVGYGWTQAVCADCRRQGQAIEAARETAAAAKETTAAVKETAKAVVQTTAAVQENTEAVRETTAAVQENTEAVRETTAAVRQNTAAVARQTDVLRQGFAATVDELQAQTAELKVHGELLASIDSTMRAAVGELAGIREDLYATTKNREALEAKSKLERADHLLASDLPEDALKLIGDAEQLNPADFSVWYAKTCICQRALYAEPPFMDRDEARKQGLRALERALKLFPAPLIARPQTVLLASSMAAASLSLASQSNFQLSMDIARRCVEQTGVDPVAAGHVATLTRLVDAANLSPSGTQLVDLNFAVMAAALRERGDSVVAPLAAGWSHLESVRPGSGKRVVEVILDFIKQSIPRLRQIVIGAVTPQPEWPTKEDVRFAVAGVEQGLSHTVRAFGQIVTYFAPAAQAYPELAPALAAASRVVQTANPAGWRAAVESKHGPYQKKPIRDFAVAVGLVVLVSLFLSKSSEGLKLWIVLASVPLLIIGKKALPEFPSFLSKPPDRTRAVLEQMLATANAWTA